MRYMVTGGGSGGHVTPVKHVVTSLKRRDKDAEVTYIGQRGDRFADLITDEDVRAKKLIFAGKYRRYPRARWKTIIDIPTHLLNLRDLFYVGIGYVQSLLIIRKAKPNALFVKGGYVSVPVGLAAATLKVPIITHDSDLIPGLANKLVARWARYNCVASSAGDYPYEVEKIQVVGVPINEDFFQEVDDERQLEAKKAIGAGEDNPVILVLGGSLGAKSINDTMVNIAEDLIENYIEAFHVTGSINFQEVKEQTADIDMQGMYHLIDFISDQKLLLEHYIAADLIVSRAGATNTAEVAGLNKPAIIIPAQQLADQQANAKEIEQEDAAVVLQDDELRESPEKLFEAIDLVLKDEELAASISDNMHKMVNENAAHSIAELLIEVARG